MKSNQPKKRKTVSKIKKKEKESENKLCAIAIKQLIKLVKKRQNNKNKGRWATH